MANALFTNYANLLLGNGTHALPDWDTNNIRASLIDHGADTPAPTTDFDYADIVSGEIAESANLTVSAPSSGAVDVADFTYSAVSGASAESLVYFLETASDATQTLMIFIDTATGLPVTPNGGDITVTVAGAGVLGFI